MATLVLLRLAALTGESRYREAADGALATITGYTARYPTAFAMWLQATDLAVSAVAEVAIVGPLDDPATRDLLQVASAGFAPSRVVAAAPEDLAGRSAVPLLRDRPLVRGRPTAYVCRGFACRLPVTDPDALREQLVEVAAAV